MHIYAVKKWQRKGASAGITTAAAGIYVKGCVFFICIWPNGMGGCNSVSVLRRGSWEWYFKICLPVVCGKGQTSHFWTRALFDGLVCSVRDFATFAEVHFDGANLRVSAQLYLLRAEIDSAARVLKICLGLEKPMPTILNLMFVLFFVTNLWHYFL